MIEIITFIVMVELALCLIFSLLGGVLFFVFLGKIIKEYWSEQGKKKRLE